MSKRDNEVLKEKNPTVNFRAKISAPDFRDYFKDSPNLVFNLIPDDQRIPEEYYYHSAGNKRPGDSIRVQFFPSKSIPGPKRHFLVRIPLSEDGTTKLFPSYKFPRENTYVLVKISGTLFKQSMKTMKNGVEFKDLANISQIVPKLRMKSFSPGAISDSWNDTNKDVLITYTKPGDPEKESESSSSSQSSVPSKKRKSSPEIPEPEREFDSEKFDFEVEARATDLFIRKDPVFMEKASQKAVQICLESIQEKAEKAFQEKFASQEAELKTAIDARKKELEKEIRSLEQKLQISEMRVVEAGCNHILNDPKYREKCLKKAVMTLMKREDVRKEAMAEVRKVQSVANKPDVDTQKILEKTLLESLSSSNFLAQPF